MGRIVSNFFISLDGVVEAPDQWHFQYFNEEMGAAIEEGVAACTAFLLGRRLYDKWAAYWPGQLRTEPDGVREAAEDFAVFINRVPKYVVSDTLAEATWANTTIVSGDVATKIREIKDRTDGNIVMSGSATLVRWLLATGLVDELNLMVHPIVVGRGQRLFQEASTHRLELKGHKALRTGVLALSYVPASD